MGTLGCGSFDLDLPTRPRVKLKSSGRRTSERASLGGSDEIKRVVKPWVYTAPLLTGPN